MPPEESTPQPAPESPSPVTETPAPAVEPATPPQEASPATTAPEAPPAPIEEAPALETAQPPTPTGQIPPNDPLPPKPDPIQPPSAAAPAQTGILHTARDLLVKARVALQDRKRKKRDKIMQALNTKTKITNDEVEKLLHISDSTAARYLAVLVKEGKLKQDKRTGAGVSYSRAQ